MRHLKYFKKYEISGSDNLKIDLFCDEHHIYNYHINEDGSIDVDEGVLIYNKNLNEIPIKFNKVRGDFTISSNSISELKNSPNQVGDNFRCENNKLTTLLGGPNNVIGFNYDCSFNNLKDVYGFPDYFEGVFWSKGNPVDEIINYFYLYEKEKRKYIKFLNEYQVIRNGDTVIESRLRDALAEIDVYDTLFDVYDTLFLDKNDFKNYKII